MSTPRGGWRRGSRVSNGHAATSTHPPRGGRLKEPLLSHRAKTLERAQEASAHDDLCRSPMMQIPQVDAFVVFCPSSLQVSTRTTRRGGGGSSVHGDRNCTPRLTNVGSHTPTAWCTTTNAAGPALTDPRTGWAKAASPAWCTATKARQTRPDALRQGVGFLQRLRHLLGVSHRRASVQLGEDLLGDVFHRRAVLYLSLNPQLICFAQYSIE